MWPAQVIAAFTFKAEAVAANIPWDISRPGEVSHYQPPRGSKVHAQARHIRDKLKQLLLAPEVGLLREQRI